MKIHNFSAGPSILPPSVLAGAASAIENFADMGLSLLEVSHRSSQFEAVVAETEALVRELLGLTDDYSVCFVTGGASTAFSLVPMNLLDDGETAAYTDTGTWAAKAIKAAKDFGKVDVLASSKAENYTHIPALGTDYTVDPAKGYKYFHYTTNNTIYGTQMHSIPDVGNVPLVADMSSDILSRRIDGTKFGMIYAGAQKNIGPAGVTLIIVRKDLLGKVKRAIPAILDYRTHIDNGSMYNTPPVFSIYVMMLTLRWIQQTGIDTIEANNRRKAETMYAAIDSNPLFKGTVAERDRSWMNANFVTVNPAHEALFTEHCKAVGISGLPGHRSVGGFRASMYNALPLESVEYLVAQMEAFAKNQ